MEEEKKEILASKVNKVLAAATSVVKKKMLEKPKRKHGVRLLKGMTLNKLLFSPEVRQAIEELIEASDMNQGSKEFFKKMFSSSYEKKRFVRAILGDERSVTSLFAEKMFTNEDFNRFVNIMKQLYLRLSPLALVRQTEIMLSKNTPVETALKAAQDIQNRAGLQAGAHSQSNSLPVTVVIKMPNKADKNLTQVNILSNNGEKPNTGNSI